MSMSADMVTSSIIGKGLDEHGNSYVDLLRPDRGSIY